MTLKPVHSQLFCEKYIFLKYISHAKMNEYPYHLLLIKKNTTWKHHYV